MDGTRDRTFVPECNRPGGSLLQLSQYHPSVASHDIKNGLTATGPLEYM